MRYNIRELSIPACAGNPIDHHKGEVSRVNNMSRAMAAILCLIILCAFTGLPYAQEKAAEGEAPSEQEAKSQAIEDIKEALKAAQPPAIQTGEFSDKGVNIQFSVKPLLGGEVMEGSTAEIRFRITDATTGAPVASLFPGSWVDIKSDTAASQAVGPITCQEKMKAYFQGVVAYRPLIDLNGYYMLAMNNDASISVVDPYVSLAGRTSLFAQIILRGYPEDWSYGIDEKFLFVTLPRENLVSVVDTEQFRVAKNIGVGPTPTRIRLQPDKKYLWVGQDSLVKGEGGVTVVDVSKQEKVKTILTGDGRHEIAFTTDSLFAFVTNSKDDILTVIDVQKLEKVKDIPIGAGPVSVAYSPLSKAAYVANFGDGAITVIDGTTFKEIAKLRTKPGLSVLRIAPGDRWVFVANSLENVVYIIDSSNNAIAHTVEVEKEPYQLAFSKTFAYVRSMGDPIVTMIDYTVLGRQENLRINKVQAGDQPPGTSRYHSVADAMLPTFMEGHVLIANPGDERVHYYMEGMSSMMGSFRSYGGQVPKAVLTVNRNLKPVDPGVYATTIRVPATGNFEVAIFLDVPRLGHCFTFSAKPSPISLGRSEPDFEVLTKEIDFAPGQKFTIKLKIFDAVNNKPIEEVKDLVMQAIHSTGFPNNKFLAKHAGEGVYEIPLFLSLGGSYYGVLTSQSKNWNPSSFHPLVLVTRENKVEVMKPGSVTGEGKQGTRERLFKR
jgi:YVTN family beta-propeller protein